MPTQPSIQGQYMKSNPCICMVYEVETTKTAVYHYGCRIKPVCAGLGCSLGWTLALSVTHSAPLRRFMQRYISSTFNLFYCSESASCFKRERLFWIFAVCG